MPESPLTPSARALIEAEFLRRVYVAERMRLAQLAGHLPAPEPDPLGLRLLHRAWPELASDLPREPFEAC